MAPKLLLILLASALLLSSAEPDTLIYHDRDYQLKWSDFRGPVEDGLESYSAVSYVGFRLGYKGTPRQDSLIVVVEAFFNPDKSWHKADTSAYLLQHEQVHFDITELYTRKLKQQLQSATLTYKTYQQTIKDLEKKVRAEMNTVDSVYEAATDKSLYKPEQLKWNTNIRQDLDKLKMYEPDTFKVPVTF